MDRAEMLLRIEDWRHLDPAAQEGGLAELLERERAEQLSPARGAHLGLAAQRRSVRLFVRDVTKTMIRDTEQVETPRK
ncbi:MAG TPA: hypothetical protein VL242_14030 [Sorangium sp.]|nr:hypothetical protein [Sorangium sp.]